MALVTGWLTGATGSCRVPGLVAERAIGQCLGKVQPADPVGVIEICERAGDAQHPVITARRQPHRFGRFPQQLLTLRIGLGNFVAGPYRFPPETQGSG